MERNIIQSERSQFGSSADAFLGEASPKTSALNSRDRALSSQTMVSDGKLPAFEIA